MSHNDGHRSARSTPTRENAGHTPAYSGFADRVGSADEERRRPSLVQQGEKVLEKFRIGDRKRAATATEIATEVSKIIGNNNNITAAKTTNDDNAAFQLKAIECYERAIVHEGLTPPKNFEEKLKSAVEYYMRCVEQPLEKQNGEVVDKEPVILAVHHQSQFAVYTSCKLCDTKGHRSGECNVYKSEYDRLRRCEEKNLCANCLKYGHSKLRCMANPICACCKNSGHVAVFCPVNLESIRKSTHITKPKTNFFALGEGATHEELVPTPSKKLCLENVSQNSSRATIEQMQNLLNTFIAQQQQQQQLPIEIVEPCVTNLERLSSSLNMYVDACRKMAVAAEGLGNALQHQKDTMEQEIRRLKGQNYFERRIERLAERTRVNKE